MDNGRKAYSKQAVTLRTGREVDELLRELYLGKRYSQQEIADALGVSRSLVMDWLNQYGIRREDRPPVELPA